MEPRRDKATCWKELASRTSDGLEVTLVWHPGDKDVKVRVIDARTDEAFELTVAGENALAAFYHPYAYAA
jgi:hypothetical protein